MEGRLVSRLARSILDVPRAGNEPTTFVSGDIAQNGFLNGRITDEEAR